MPPFTNVYLFKTQLYLSFYNPGENVASFSCLPVLAFSLALNVVLDLFLLNHPITPGGISQSISIIIYNKMDFTTLLIRVLISIYKWIIPNINPCPVTGVGVIILREGPRNIFSILLSSCVRHHRKRGGKNKAKMIFLAISGKNCSGFYTLHIDPHCSGFHHGNLEIILTLLLTSSFYNQTKSQFHTRYESITIIIAIFIFPFHFLLHISFHPQV